MGPNRRDFVSRYQQGDYEAVWREIRSEQELDNPAFRAEAAEVAVLTMQRVRANVEIITQRLTAAGYPFDDFLPPWSLPAVGVAEQIKRIELAADGPCPITLRAFWIVVGEVNWKHAEDVIDDDPPWGKFAIEEADPLFVNGPEVAWEFVKDWLELRKEDGPEDAGPLKLSLAPDYLHKANISGGEAYSIEAPSRAADPLFENEEHNLPFVEYLRLCFRYGGFSRIDKMVLPTRAATFIDMMGRGLESF